MITDKEMVLHVFFWLTILQAISKRLPHYLFEQVLCELVWLTGQFVGKTNSLLR